MLLLVVGHCLGLVVGISLGLLGGGGAILTVPILIYVLGQGIQEAIATSLICIGLVSLIGVIPHWKQGHVCLKTAIMFGPPAMLGAYLGAKASESEWITDSLQLICFASVALVSSLLMIFKQKQPLQQSSTLGSDSQHINQSRGKYLAIPVEGLGIGALTGFVGIGGGIAIVPALALLAGIPTQTTVGTSLLIIASKSLTGFIGYMDIASIKLGLLVTLTLLACLGSILGAQLGRYFNPNYLQKPFGYFIMVVAIFSIAKSVNFQL